MEGKKYSFQNLGNTVLLFFIVIIIAYSGKFNYDLPRRSGKDVMTGQDDVTEPALGLFSVQSKLYKGTR